MKIPEAIDHLQAELKAAAIPEKAPEMAAYMKTEMPFYGVPAPARKLIVRDLKKKFVPQDAQEHSAYIQALWALPHREEKYVAIDLAKAWKDWIDADHLSLYRQWIEEGAWWDLVDDIAYYLVGGAYLKDREKVGPIMDEWITDPHLWIRRAAIICQLRHKKETDAVRLYDYCLRSAHEKDFFIRKAIGWALRQYSRSEPESVHEFLTTHRKDLSNLSFKEGSRILIKNGWSFEET